MLKVGRLLLSCELAVVCSAASLRFEKDAVIPMAAPTEELPVWSWGSMVRVQRSNTAAPVVSALDESGSLTSVTLKLPDAYRIVVSGLTRGRDGVFALSGWSADDSGRLAGFIALIAGQDPPRVIRTNPYFPQNIAMADDGSLWTVNVVTTDGREVKTDYNVLRHYDRTGTLLGSAIPRSSISEGRYISDGTGRMAACLGRIGWYTGPHSGSGSEYIEVQPDGTILRLPGVTLSKYESITGLALTNSLSLVSVQDTQAHKRRIVAVDPLTRRWEPVSVENFGGSIPWIYGGDGDRVVAPGNDLNTVNFFRALK